MSIYGAMFTAISGLSAQTRKIGHISDNIANVSTVGYKKIGTSFTTLVSQSSQKFHEPGGVTAAPAFNVGLQGAIETSATKTHVAINGDGFFAVQNFPSDTDATVGLARQLSYTRKGDFRVDANGNFVNSSGYYLQGWQYDATGNAFPSKSLETINIANIAGVVQPTSTVVFGANLPASAEQANANNNVANVTLDDFANVSQVQFTVGGATITADTSAGVPYASLAALVAAVDAAVSAQDASLSVAAGGANELVVTDAGGRAISALTVTGQTATSGPTYSDTNITAATLNTLKPLDPTLKLSEGANTSSVSDKFTEQVWYDDLGRPRTVRTEWWPGAESADKTTRDWYMRSFEVDADGKPMQNAASSYTISTVTFNNESTSNGGTLSDAGGDVEFDINGNATLPVDVGFGAVNMSVGRKDEAVGITQYSKDFSVTTLSQDGLPYGQFQDVRIDENGDVFANFGNGAFRRIYRIPMITFSNPDGLQLRDGGIYEASVYSGDPVITDAGVGRAGTFAPEATEASNVDIAEEFTQMIQAQRAYSANSRVITTSDEMLEEIINLKR